MEKEDLRTKILVVDDNQEFLESIKRPLKDNGFITLFTSSVELAQQHISQCPDVILLDLFLPTKEDGFTLLKLLRERLPECPIIIVTAFGEVQEAIEAIRQGAADYIQKKEIGQHYETLFLRIRKVLEPIKLQKELRESRLGQFGFAGRNRKTLEMFSLIEKVAPTDSTVLITGESGTGKELVAQAIHKLSNRKNKPIVEVNCAAIPSELIESELFGHVKGSFTGATTDRTGKFELADKSTLFLDEIGDLSLSAQAKILRALQEKIIEKVGDIKKIEVDVRIISATNKNLQEEIRNGNLREDLYHRLNTIPIEIAPLRERKEEIPQIAEYYLSFFNRKLMKNVLINPDVMQTFMNYYWPGNIRELMNLIERGVILASNEILLDHIGNFIKPLPNSNIDTLDSNLKRAESIAALNQFENALKETGQITKASEKLYKNRFSMSNRIKSINERYPDLIEQFPVIQEFYPDIVK